MKLTFSFSPCPNDCFMFEAIVKRRIDLENLEFSIQLKDIETLNRDAFAGSAEITKLSFHAYAYCLQDYVLLNAGSALGWNCGPLLISKRKLSDEELHGGHLRIVIPGKYTTANLLLTLALPTQQDRTELLFSEIESALLANQYDAGLIIHENRFTYEAKSFQKIIDLGEFWEKETGLPLPLGGIVIKRSLSEEVKQKVSRIVRRSVDYALVNRYASRDFILANAKEIDELVIDRHIDLYVNANSIDLGEEGRRSIQVLFDRASANGIFTSGKTLFLE